MTSSDRKQVFNCQTARHFSQMELPDFNTNLLTLKFTLGFILCAMELKNDIT